VSISTTCGLTAAQAPIKAYLFDANRYGLCTNGKIKAFGIEFDNGSFVGSCNASYMHFYTGAAAGFYMNKNVSVCGNVYDYQGYWCLDGRTLTCSYLHLSSCCSLTYQFRVYAQYYFACPVRMTGYGGTEFFAMRNGSGEMWFCSGTCVRIQSPITYVCTLLCTSDYYQKTDFQETYVLPGIRKIWMPKYRFKDGQAYQIGPMAQSIQDVFGFSSDGKSVWGLSGIALKGVQELDGCVSYNNRRILELESRNACLETRLSCLETEIIQLKEAA
jgi:hypothetical protein